MALERRTVLMVLESMKPWPKFLQGTFRHPAQVNPGQASTNKSLQRTSSGNNLGKSDRAPGRLTLNSNR